jgi:hypothetical protein
MEVCAGTYKALSTTESKSTQAELKREKDRLKLPLDMNKLAVFLQSILGSMGQFCAVDPMALLTSDIRRKHC